MTDPIPGRRGTNMKALLACLSLLACSTGLPPPGSPDAALACESLRLTVEAVRANYGRADDWLARTAFLLQAREYDEELQCPDVTITDEELRR